MSPIVLQTKSRLQALYQDNRSIFPFAYHDVPTALAPNNSMKQSLSWEANFCSLIFLNLTVVNIQNTSPLRCNIVQFGTQVITFRGTCCLHLLGTTAFHLTMPYHLLIHSHMTWLFPATWLQPGWSGVRIPLGTRDFYFLLNVHTGPGTHPASNPVGTAVPSPE
jgi:hypothetical protein